MTACSLSLSLAPFVFRPFLPFLYLITSPSLLSYCLALFPSLFFFLVFFPFFSFSSTQLFYCYCYSYSTYPYFVLLSAAAKAAINLKAQEEKEKEKEKESNMNKNSKIELEQGKFIFYDLLICFIL